MPPPSSLQPKRVGAAQGRPKGRENQSELLSPLRALMAAAQTAARGRKCRERFPSELPESLFGRRPGRAASLGGGPRAEPCAPWRPRSRRRRRRPPRSPPGAPPPGPSPVPAPGPGPRRPRGAPRARAGERAPLTRSSRSAPRSRRSQVHVRPADCPRSRRGRAERGRERPPARVTPHAAPRRRCHPGPATPTFRTVAELEVSGLRGRWAGFLQCRLSLATKRESRLGEGRKERNTMGRGPATEKSPGLEIPPEAFFACFFLSGKHPPQLRMEPLLWSHG